MVCQDISPQAAESSQPVPGKFAFLGLQLFQSLHVPNVEVTSLGSPFPISTVTAEDVMLALKRNSGEPSSAASLCRWGTGLVSGGNSGKSVEKPSHWGDQDEDFTYLS